MIGWKKAMKLYVYVRSRKEMDLLFEKLQEKYVVWSDGTPLHRYKPALNENGGLAFIMDNGRPFNGIKYSSRHKPSESFFMNDMDWSDDSE